MSVVSGYFFILSLSIKKKRGRFVEAGKEGCEKLILGKKTNSATNRDNA
jgi:hypothetical protein